MEEIIKRQKELIDECKDGSKLWKGLSDKCARLLTTFDQLKLNLNIDNRIKFNEMYSENDIERGLEMKREQDKAYKNQHGG